MKKVFSKKSKLIVFTLATLTSIISFIYAIMLIQLYFETNTHIKKFSNDINKTVSEKIDSRLSEAESVSFSLIQRVKKIVLEKEAIWGELESVRYISEGILGVGINFEPYALGDSVRLFSPYIYRTYDGYKRASLDDSYDYSIDQNNPENNAATPENHLKEQPHWSTPTFDEQGKCLIIKYSAPLMVENQLMGVSYTNLCLKDLASEITKFELGNDSYFLLLDAKKNVLYNSINSSDMQKFHGKLPKIILDRNKEWFSERKINGKSSWLHTRKLQHSDWYLLTVISKDIHHEINKEVKSSSSWGKLTQSIPLSSPNSF